MTTLPRKAYVTVPPGLREPLRRAAEREEATLPALLVRVLRAYLQERHPDLYAPQYPRQCAEG